MEFSPSNADPQAHLWEDPEFMDAYMDALCREYDARVARGERPGDVAESESPWSAPDVLDEEPSTDDDLDAAGDLIRRLRATHAEADAMFADVLASAASDPTPWTGPDPTEDPGWTHPAGWSPARVRARRRDIAVRSAAADLGLRVGLTDLQVRSRAHRAAVLQTRCPQTWNAYVSGDVSEQNAATAATVADSLPPDPEVWETFDEAVHGSAQRLVPGKFRTRARAVRERVHPESVEERHTRAAADRTVEFTPEQDGMSSLFALIPSVRARVIEERLEGDARHLAAHADETRSLAQLRADALCDLLAGRDGAPVPGIGADAPGAAADADVPEPAAGAEPESTAPNTDQAPAPVTCPVGRVKTVVHLTVPALTLLGHSDEPATLDGVGPISLDEARRFAGDADEWVRVLTHPITGTVLDVERRAYRVPKSLRRWLGVKYPTCIFPGCSRPATRCDMDHARRWADGGDTSAANNAPECARHHPVKDESLWSLTPHPDTGDLRWRSPTGVVTDLDPPPF